MILIDTLEDAPSRAAGIIYLENGTRPAKEQLLEMRPIWTVYGMTSAPLRPHAPSYVGLKPASERARKAASGASKKSGTRCEMLLRRALWRLGMRYRVNGAALPGRPDLVFTKARVAVFCDGDFWHGRDLEARIKRLTVGHNAPYWVAKIRRNVERDLERNAALSAMGWLALRVWESEIARDAEEVARRVVEAVRQRE